MLQNKDTLSSLSDLIHAAIKSQSRFRMIATKTGKVRVFFPLLNLEFCPNVELPDELIFAGKKIMTYDQQKWKVKTRNALNFFGSYILVAYINLKEWKEWLTTFDA